ncbi:MAG: EamA family transporter [bacterium]|nr:EamA family transporter [bacterium]
MIWILYAFGAAAIWACINILDKFVVTRWVRNHLVPFLFTAIANAVTLAVIWLWFDIERLPAAVAAAAALSGALYIIGAMLYFRALQLEEVSRVVPLFYLGPLFTAVLAWIFVGEVFGFATYVGVALLIAGSVLVSVRKFEWFRPTPAFWMMVGASFLLSAGGVSLKYALDAGGFWSVFLYGRVGELAVTIPLAVYVFKDFIAAVREHGKRVAGIMLLTEALDIAAVVLYTLAAATGFVTLVAAFVSLNAFFAFVLVLVLSIWFPRILHEEYSAKIILQKLIAIALMFAGVLLVL